MSFAIFMVVVLLCVGAITPRALGWTGEGILASAGGAIQQRRSEFLVIGGIAALTFAAFLGAIAVTY